MLEFNNFIKWERTSRDTIDFKKIYCDIADDVIAGLMLSEIVYWYLPSKNGKSKLRVERDDYLWIVIRREDWWNRIRVSARQADKAIGRLIERGVIKKEIYKFNGEPTTHLRIVEEKFLELWDYYNENPQDYNDEENDSEISKSPNGEIGNHQTVNSNLPNGDLHIQRLQHRLPGTKVDKSTFVDEQFLEDGNQDVNEKGNIENQSFFVNAELEDSQITCLRPPPIVLDNNTFAKPRPAGSTIGYHKRSSGIKKADIGAAPVTQVEKKKRNNRDELKDWLISLLRIFDLEYTFNGRNYDDPDIGHYLKTARTLKNAVDKNNQQYSDREQYDEAIVVELDQYIRDWFGKKLDYTVEVFARHINKFLIHKREQQELDRQKRMLPMPKKPSHPVVAQNIPLTVSNRSLILERTSAILPTNYFDENQVVVVNDFEEE